MKILIVTSSILGNNFSSLYNALNTINKIELFIFSYNEYRFDQVKSVFINRNTLYSQVKQNKKFILNKSILSKELSAIIFKINIDVIFCIQDKYVPIVSLAIKNFKKEIYFPSLDVIETLSDKYQLYKLAKHSIETPVCFLSIEMNKISRYLHKEKIMFCKKRIQTSSRESFPVSSLKELKKNNLDMCIVCENLELPEYNLTLIIKNMELKLQLIYETIKDKSGITHDAKIVHNDTIYSIGKKIHMLLISSFSKNNINGIYNFDIMMRGNKFILNECNPGRFGSFFSLIFKNELKNILKICLFEDCNAIEIKEKKLELTEFLKNKIRNHVTRSIKKFLSK